MIHIESTVITRDKRHWVQKSADSASVRKLMKKLRDATLVAILLGLRSEQVAKSLEGWDKCPRDEGYKPQDVPGAWSRNELVALGQLWNSGYMTHQIAKALKRTRSSVSAKRRGLGLPARIQISKGDAIRRVDESRRETLALDRSVTLTWAQASLLTQEERRGRTWYLRNCTKTITLTGMLRNNKVSWNEAASLECAHRYFARQHHRVIAEDFLLTNRSVRCHADLEECTVSGSRKRFLYFLMDSALEHIEKENLVQRSCSMLHGARFWTAKRGFRRISKRYKKSAAARNDTMACSLAA